MYGTVRVCYNYNIPIVMSGSSTSFKTDDAAAITADTADTGAFGICVGIPAHSP